MVTELRSKAPLHNYTYPIIMQLIRVLAELFKTIIIVISMDDDKNMVLTIRG